MCEMELAILHYCFYSCKAGQYTKLLVRAKCKQGLECGLGVNLAVLVQCVVDNSVADRYV
jgi:hypothetical protein